MKNIPIPPNSEYIKRLIEKVEDFTKRLRWRVFYFLNPDAKPDHKETYGFKSSKSPPSIPQLKPFEEDLLKLIENIKFRKVHSPLQDQLKEDSKKIRSNKNLLVPADKTNNYYSVNPQQYDKLMKDNVTTTYKRSDRQSVQATNMEAKIIAQNLELSDRMEVLAEIPAYITLKDHKENFRSHPTCRLINPAKGQIGIVSKQVLDRINGEVLKATKVNQWKNSGAVIHWFNSITTRQNSTFISFDIVNFYPTITKDLMLKALQFAKRFTKITPEEEDIILKAKNTFLFHGDTPWQKANTSDLFDVTMGSYDGAESCELVGTYILNEISNIIPKENIGLYRDDGLAVISKPAAIAERIKKKLCEKFKQFGLQITATANTKVTDFLDVTFDLPKREHRPYTKPGNKHLYVHVDSNHPPIITKIIPQSIETRLSNISSNQKIFEDAKPEYEKALHEAGHTVNLTYKQKDSQGKKGKRKRKITWFNPPYSVHVESNIGKKFLTLLDRHFPKGHELHKVCNRNTVKLSYSCMDNMAATIKAHNNKILNREQNLGDETCNCRKKQDCPLPGKCTAQNVVYEAKVSTSNDDKYYIGLTSTTFKSRFAGHKTSFNNRGKMNHTELSKHVWTLKDEGTPYKITWRIVRHAQPYSPRTKRCNLCLWEKYFIITAPKHNILNSRTELISTCRHKKKFLLSGYG